MRIIQDLAIHEFAASSFYGVAISEQRKSESHIRPVEQMLDRILALDEPPADSCPGHHGAEQHVDLPDLRGVLFLAMLRAKRIPARGRVGFGAYFNPGIFEDHVVRRILEPFGRTLEARRSTVR